jgi:hypothetical protein
MRNPDNGQPMKNALPITPDINHNIVPRRVARIIIEPEADCNGSYGVANASNVVQGLIW